jgi:hypothetical protein
MARRCTIRGLWLLSLLLLLASFATPARINGNQKKIIYIYNLIFKILVLLIFFEKKRTHIYLYVKQPQLTAAGRARWQWGPSPGGTRIISLQRNVLPPHPLLISPTCSAAGEGVTATHRRRSASPTAEDEILHQPLCLISWKLIRWNAMVSIDWRSRDCPYFLIWTAENK